MERRKEKGRKGHRRDEKGTFEEQGREKERNKGRRYGEKK